MKLAPRKTAAARAIGVAAAIVVASVGVGAVGAANADVSIVGTAFEPANVTVNVGDTVTWTVTESIGEPHSVTSGTPADAGKVFDSGASNNNNTFNLRDEGQTFQHTFEEAGEYPYFCVIHPIDMTGKVVVVAAGASVPPSVAPPPSEAHVGVPVERRALAGGILAISIVLMFGAAWLWRRMNPA